MVTASPSAKGSAPGASLYQMYIVALLSCLIGNLLVRMGARGGWLPEWGQVALAVISALPLAMAAAMFWRLLSRDLDEMLQRIVLEGLAFGLVVYVPLAGLYVNLRTAGVWTPRLDAPDILLAPAMLVAVGIAIAWRRHT